MMTFVSAIFSKMFADVCVPPSQRADLFCDMYQDKITFGLGLLAISLKDEGDS